jgi:DNA end-binding protein Ku
MLETLFFAEDVRSREEIDEAVGGTEVKDAELELARQVIASLEGDFEAEDFGNDYRTELRQMLEAKLEGREISRPEPVPEAPVVDLMDALKRSVAEVQERTATDGRKAKAPAKRPARRKAAAKR